MDVVERSIEFSDPMNAFNANIQAELEDRLRFETVLAELSARFVKLPPERVDQEIEDALRRLVAALQVDRTALGLSLIHI